MLTRKVFKMKDSRLVTLPADICNMLNIKVGDRLKIELEGTSIVMTPTPTAGLP